MKQDTLLSRIARRSFVCLLVGCSGANHAITDDDAASAPHSAAVDGQSDGEGARAPSAGVNDDAANTSNQQVTRVRIAIGQTTLSATLYDNATARACRAMLPLTLRMADLNANEKHAQLPSRLPTDASDPGTIHEGDLMLYGSSTFVLFYKTFATSYDYTRVGRVDDSAALAAALSPGDVTVTFSE
jgi:hypothetical protein